MPVARPLALVLALLITAGCGGSRSAADAPLTLSGTWAGEGRQWNDGDRSREPDERWLVRVTLVDDGITPTATIEYPELGCSGTLAYVGANTAADAQPGDRIFREDITGGADQCVTGGTVLLRPSRNALIYAWAMDGRPTVAAARLERQR